MAAVLDALAPYVRKLITDMVEEEVSMLLGVSGDITELGGKAANMEAYMADAERRRIDDARVQRWVSKLKSALYEATDILELCQLDAEETQGSRWATMEKKLPGCLLPLLFCLRNPSFAHGLGDRIKKLNEGLDSIRKEMADLEFVKLDPYKLQTPPSDATSRSRITTSLLDESAVVGDAIEVETKAVVQELLANEPAIKVVSITGPGGMGKTTLAKKILNDKQIQEEFPSKIWLSVTQRYNARELVSSAITQAHGGEKDPHGDLQVLTQILVTTLSAGKFLLVMDDVWSNMPWTDVLQSPVLKAGQRQPGSRVIITTRNEHLVKDMGAAYCLRHIKPLCDEDAWSLLKKQLPAQDVGGESALDQLKHIGIEIIRNCDGLPLAIKAIGGLLRMKRVTEHDWKVVLHDPAWKTDIAHADLNSALRLSYEDLSPAVKQCFLYFSLIPKGFQMDSGDVIGMWNGEGFLEVAHSIDGRRKEVEDIGISYYRDLIIRNLIEQKEVERGHGPACVMHDVIRSFARYMAKEEALVVGSGHISSLVSSPKFRRLCVEETELESEAAVLQDWSGIFEKQEFLRSLIICDRMKFEPNTSGFSLSRFPSLRVIFLFEAESDRFIGSLGKLKHLRFLLLWRTDVSRLPEEIGRMRFLEHIHVQECGNFDGQVPSSMLNLERLRYLSIIDDTRFIVPKGLSGLTNLRMLRNFPVQIEDEWCSLEEVGPLSLLRTLELGNLGVVPSASLAAKAKIRNKLQLRDLTLSCNMSDIGEVTEEDCKQVEEVLNELCPPPQLGQLVIEGYIGCRLPLWMCSSTTARGASSSIDFNSLTYLVLQGLLFCRELPDGLCQLPNLETLEINYSPAVRRVGAEFQRPQTVGGSSSLATRMSLSFPRLQFLELDELPNWEEWEWEEEEGHASIAMPSLHKLVIAKSKLGCLPAGLASSRRLALKELVLYDVSRITAVENFPSVVELHVRRCPSLMIIRGFPQMQSICIASCPALELLEAAPVLDTVALEDPGMETLPEYLRDLKPRIVRVNRCRQKLRDLLSSSDDSSSEYRAEMDKVKQCGKLVVL